MSQQDQHIKDIFSEKLGGFEAPVDPSLFAGVQAGISGPAGSAAGGSWISGLSTGTKVVAAAFIAGTIGVGTWLATSDNSASDEQPVSEKIVETSTPAITEEINEKSDLEDAFAPLENADQTGDAELTPSTTESSTESIELEAPIENTYHSEALEPYELVRGTEEMTRTPDAPAPEAQQEVTALSSTQEEQTEASEAEKPVKADFTAVRSEGNPMQFEFKSVDAGKHPTYWSLGDGHVSSSPVFTYEFEQEGEFEVELTVGEGVYEQIHTATVVAYLQPEVVIPNVFTPNGDAFNPYFDVESKSTNVTVMNVQVFDMNGNVVFESVEDSLKWDGNDRFGQPCAVGNYICLVQAIGVDQEPINQREIVSLKR